MLHLTGIWRPYRGWCHSHINFSVVIGMRKLQEKAIYWLAKKSLICHCDRAHECELLKVKFSVAFRRQRNGLKQLVCTGIDSIWVAADRCRKISVFVSGTAGCSLWCNAYIVQLLGDVWTLACTLMHALGPTLRGWEGALGESSTSRLSPWSARWICARSVTKFD